MCMHICEDQGSEKVSSRESKQGNAEGKSDFHRDTERHTSKAFEVTTMWESDRNIILPSFTLDFSFCLTIQKKKSTCIYLCVALDASHHAITMMITDGPLASLLLVHLYFIMSCAVSHSVFVCVFRTLQAPQPFSGSQPQVLWSSRETRGSTFLNGTQMSQHLKYKCVNIEIK